MKRLNEIFDTEYDTLINDIKTNSKEVNKGDLFVCIKGFNADRHDYVNDALENGASALVVEHKVDSNLPQIIVDNTNDELVNIVNKFYDYPSTKMKIIGITGTDGKTTTSTILYNLLNQVSNAGYIGTNGVHSKNYKNDSNNTTPTPEHLHKFLNDLYNDGCKYICMETASEGLCQNRCKDIMFDYSIFTNLTPEHLNYHKTMENYLDAKGILFKQTKESGYSIINIDDKYSKEIAKFCKSKVIYYGESKDALFRFSDIIYNEKYTMFTLNYNNEKKIIKMPLLGKFNVYNMTAALSLLITLGYNIDTLNFDNLFVDGRMNFIDLGQDFTVIVDYAHTPNGYINLFNYINKLDKNNVIVVAGTAGERDKTKRPLMGKILTDNADHVIFTYEDPRSEDVNDIINDLTSDIKKDNYERVIDRKEAIKKAINIASKNDIVLVLGKGNETYECLKDGKIYFNDIEEVKKALEDRVKV